MIDLPDITSESEEGSCDLTFAAASHSVRPDASHEIVARGIHHGTPVGFTAVLLPKWEPREIEGIPRTLYRGGVTIGADGAAGDAFLKAINELYGTREAPGRMAGRVFFSAIALKGRPPAVLGEPVKLKLFFEAGVDERYAEVYLNIDLDQARVEFYEKDPDYRRPLVRALTATG